MRHKLQVLVLAATLTQLSSARGQGTFQNLGFEAVSIVPPNQSGFFTFVQVFPSWIGYAGTNQATQALYNGVSVGGALISLIGPYAPQSNSVVSGYTAVLAAGSDGSGLVSVAIAQSGLVPASAQSLRFSVGSASVVNVASDLSVTLDGQDLPFYFLATGPNYTTYGSDVSAFAGGLGELRFTERPISWPFAKAYLDNIQFSSEPIPEPDVLGLFGLGALVLGGPLIRGRR